MPQIESYIPSDYKSRHRSNYKRILLPSTNMIVVEQTPSPELLRYVEDINSDDSYEADYWRLHTEATGTDKFYPGRALNRWVSHRFQFGEQKLDCIFDVALTINGFEHFVNFWQDSCNAMINAIPYPVVFHSNPRGMIRFQPKSSIKFFGTDSRGFHQDAGPDDDKPEHPLHCLGDNYIPFNLIFSVSRDKTTEFITAEYNQAAHEVRYDGRDVTPESVRKKYLETNRVGGMFLDQNVPRKPVCEEVGLFSRP